ncbi:MAG: methyltransferase domain-containing protein [Actinobacteria bacterium]|nr:methyltransferase domain-containing protein [Actinomycetota bacterium]
MSNSGRPWYETAYDRDYLRVYAHRNEAAARKEAEFILTQTPAEFCRRILDIACGTARHLVWFCAAAEFSVGLDRSEELLAEGLSRLASLKAEAALVCADMRHLPFEAEFTCATLLFTSFGYFQTDQENLAVIQQASNALVSDGVFWLDYINEPHLRETLQPHSRHTDGHRLIEQHRRITDDGRVEKRIRIVTDAGERIIDESVKLYSREGIEQMFTQSHLTVKNVWGDFDGQPHTTRSPRLIIMGAKDDF